MSTPTIKAIRFRPDYPADLTDVDNDLESLQQIVGGDIEVVPIGEAHVLIIDEEGKLKKKRHGQLATAVFGERLLPDDWIAGTALLVGSDGPEFTDVDPRLEAVLEDVDDAPNSPEILRRTCAAVMNWQPPIEVPTTPEEGDTPDEDEDESDIETPAAK